MIAPDLYSFRELWRQYRSCRRNKRVTRNALAFEADAEANLLALQRELREHTWRPGTSICFVTDGPKPREVFAADFRDRIVHHLLVSRLEPTFERSFIHDSFACRKGKGTLAGSDRLMVMLRRLTANGRRPAWALRLDVASFFTSINKRTLYRIIRRRVRDPELRWLTRVILFHDPTRDYRFNAVGPRRPGLRGVGAETRRGRFRPSPTSGRYPIPARKSLFHGGNRRGLPIGNLTSQFWANVYMDQLDQFVKRQLGCRFYLRYVDDLCLLSTDRAELLRWRAEIERFLGERLQLALRAEVAEPRPVGRGVDWIGWRTWWDHRLPRRQTLSNLRGRLDQWACENVEVQRRGDPARTVQRIDFRAARERDAVAALRSTVASYSGHLRHGRAYRVWEREWRERAWLAALFERDVWALEERWPERRIAAARTFAEQIAELTRRAGDRTLVFCRVGRYVEMRGRQRLLAERVLGLRPAWLPRGGFAFVASFPASLLGVFRARALQRGMSVLEVREEGEEAGKRRAMRRRVGCLTIAGWDATTTNGRAWSIGRGYAGKPGRAAT
ncbi:RNA-directed DNA polymerase [Candidatus Binatia bacterium]|nr:RNA-directed DNA polymerase [Candidatus Binatia bacterium]